MRILALLLPLTAATLIGCGSSSSPGHTQQPASNTAFMAFVASGSGGRIYMPSAARVSTGDPTLAVVDAAAPNGTSGVVRYLDLQGGAVPRAVGSSGTDVVVIERDGAAVQFIDARTDTVTGTAAFPAAAELMLTSNAPGYYSGGVAVDAATRKAYVSSSLGFLQFDLDTRTLTDTFAANIAEGFTLDPKAGRLYSPFYLCDPNPSDPGFCYPFVQPGGPDVTDSLDVVDLAAAKTFTLVDPSAADAHAPLGFEPDDVAIDFELGLAAVAHEGSPTVSIVDLAGATFDQVALTCQMPRTSVPMPDAGYTMLAADQATHLLVAAQEDGTGLAFVDIAKAKRGIVSMLPVTMPAKPGGGDWINLGDPHATIIGVVGGRSYAFVGASDQNWIARIDLAGVAEVMAGKGTFASHVEFISVPTPP